MTTRIQLMRLKLRGLAAAIWSKKIQQNKAQAGFRFDGT
jgi:hypothetical protein